LVEGTPFGRYRLIEMLGRGGMGEVWRAYDTEANNRTVAIKLLPAQLANDSSFVRRFRREAEAAAQLNNPHIIPIHNYGEIDGRLYVDMRLVDGRDLQQVLNAGPLEPARAVRIIEQVAKALQAAHKVGLVHRDVKPSNILVDEDDFAYLIDFGIARGADHTGLTGVGDVIGSLHYMAPERLQAHEADARADIYALACVLYECLTGSRPFPGDSIESQMAAHLTNPPPRPSTRRDVSPLLDAVIARGMAKNPDQRYPTTIELAHAARDAITVPTQRPTPDPSAHPDVAGAPTRPVEPARGVTAPAHPVWDAYSPSVNPVPPPPWSPSPALPMPAKTNRQTRVLLIVGAVVLVLVLAAGAGIYLFVDYWRSQVSSALSRPTAAMPSISVPSFSIPSFGVPTALPSSDPTSTGTGGVGTASGAKVFIDGKDQNVTGSAVCMNSGSSVTISIGGSGTGVAAMLTNSDPPEVKSVGLGNVNGVTLSYSPGVSGGSASAVKDGNTYKIAGTAIGVDMANPMQTVTKSFEIDVTCP
jgi:serine/threonine protein kinase